jgi:DNA helicase-2/ATP-dependent DNA helicase PcrA
VGYVAQNGLDDIEEEEIICPPNMVPIMTIHQAKGLEFPIVFVGDVNADAEISDSHQLEDLLGKYPINHSRIFKRPTKKQRAELDLIRQYYVAYSRPEFVLIILGTINQLSKGRIPCGPKSTWLNQKTRNITLGR